MAEYYLIHLLGDERDYPDLDQTSTFLYDFNLLYEFSRVVVDPRYSSYKFTRFSSYRNDRRLEEIDKLKIVALRQESPLALIAALAALTSAAAGALWATVQTIERISNRGLNREILELTRQKLLQDLHQNSEADASNILRDAASFREIIRIREAEYNFERVEDHLRNNPISIRELNIERTIELPQRVPRDSDHE